MLQKVFRFPSQNLVIVIPSVLLLGFIIGNLVDTTFLKKYILVGTLIMIYPTMIGMKLEEAVNLTHGKVMAASLLVNFTIIPLLAYGLGMVFFQDYPQLLAGLAIISLLPTSGMTISWTMLSKGNVAAAVKITVISLLLGSILAPWYLLWMVGKYIPVDVVSTFKTIATVVFIPLIVGNITYKILLTRLTPQEFKEKVKPYLPAVSVWALLFIIFSSISMKAKMILAEPALIWQAVIVLIIYYLVNFTISTLLGRIFLNRADSLALVYGTAVRNLSLSLGLAVSSAFGSQAALLITLAFILQVQGAAWYGRLAKTHDLFGTRGRENVPALD